MYYTKVKQNIGRRVEIQIRTQPDELAGYISARAKYNFQSQRVECDVLTNIAFSDQMTVEEARNIADWWRVAAQACETLAVKVKTHEDLEKRITAGIIGRSLKIDVG